VRFNCYILLMIKDKKKIAKRKVKKLEARNQNN